jgi:hypothetical protein
VRSGIRLLNTKARQSALRSIDNVITGATLALLHRHIPGQIIDKSMKGSRMMDGTLRQNHPKSWVNGAPQYVSRGFPLYNLEARKLFLSHLRVMTRLFGMYAKVYE